MDSSTNPRNCCECGGDFTEEIVMSGTPEPATVEIRKHQIEIPCLWRCQGCAQAIEAGRRTSEVTVESARDYLNDVAGPGMSGALIHAMMDGREEDQAMIGARIIEIIEVQEILEMVLQLRDEPGGLDFIPECDGQHGSHEHGDAFDRQRQMAPLN